MAYRTVSEVINDLNVTTADFRESVVSVINNDNWLSARLLNKSKPYYGKRIEQPLRYGREHTQTMGKYDEYNLQPVDTLEAAYYEPKHVHGDMVLTKIEVLGQNVGKAQLIDMSRNRHENMAESMKNQMSELLFAASPGTNDPESVITIAATSNNTVGGIDASDTDLPFDWNPKIEDLSSAAPVADDLLNPKGQYFLLNLLQKIVSQCTLGNDKPTIGVTTQGIWDILERIYREMEILDAQKMVADGGFEVLKYRNVLIGVDSHVPGGAMDESPTDNSAMLVLLNEKYIGFRHAPLVNFDWTDWKEAERQPILFSMLDWIGAFTCARRDRQGAITGLPTDEQIYG